jgi:hypothetical protein
MSTPERHPSHRFLQLSVCIIALAAGFGCSTPNRMAENNGAIMYRYSTEGSWADGYSEWSGGVDEKGTAMGSGIETEYTADGTLVSTTEIEYVAGIRHGPYVYKYYYNTGDYPSYEVHGEYSYGNKISASRIYVASNNGAKIKPHAHLGDYGTRVTWTGGKTRDGFAHGDGVETWYRYDGSIGETAIRTYRNGDREGRYSKQIFHSDGSVHMEGAGAYAAGRRIGTHSLKFYNDPQSRVSLVGSFDQDTLNGKYITQYKSGKMLVKNYVNGREQSSSWYEADGPPVSSHTASASSGLSDSELVGAVFALGGAYEGDATVSAAGLTMMAGNDMEAVQMLAEHTASMDSGASGVADNDESVKKGDTPAKKDKADKKPIIANKPNLITSEMRRLAQTGQQLNAYVQTAESAYRAYKQTGELTYYKQHEEAVAYAAQYIRQTSSPGFAHPSG